MNKIKTFAKTFWRSLTDISYYKDVLSAKFSFSLKYFSSLIFVISLILAITLSVRVLRILTKVPGFIASTKTFLVSTYPKELKLTLKDKKVSTNVKEPYFIDLSADNQKTIDPFKHLLAIDTGGSSEDYTKLESVFVLNSDSLVVSGGSDGSYRVIPLTDAFNKIPDGTTIDKSAFTIFLDWAEPMVAKSAPKFIIILVILILVLYSLLRTVFEVLTDLVFLLPASLVLFVGGKIMKKKISFAKMYQLSLHGATIPVTLSFVLGLTNLLYLTILTWVAFWVFMFVVISKLSFKEA